MSTTLVRKTHSFSDLDFLMVEHPITHNVSIKRDINAIRQSVINLLTLKEGNKPFHPEISSPVYKYMFENFSNVTTIILRSEITKYLQVYEPRIIVDDIDITQSSPNYVVFSIDATITGTDNSFTVDVLIDRLR